MFQKNQYDGGFKRKDFILFPSMMIPFSYPQSQENHLILYLNCYYDGTLMPHYNRGFYVNKENITIDSIYTELLKQKLHNDLLIAINRFRDDFIVIRTDVLLLQYVMIVNSNVTHRVEYKNLFGYMPMQGRFFERDVFLHNFWDIEDENYVIDMPYHLFDDHLLFYVLDNQEEYKNHFLSHRIGHYYKIYGSIKEFKDFYTSLNIFNIKEDNHQLILDGKIIKRCSSQLDTEAILYDSIITLDFKEYDGFYYVAYLFG